MWGVKACGIKLLRFDTHMIYLKELSFDQHFGLQYISIEVVEIVNSVNEFAVSNDIVLRELLIWPTISLH